MDPSSSSVEPEKSIENGNSISRTRNLRFSRSGLDSSKRLIVVLSGAELSAIENSQIEEDDDEDERLNIPSTVHQCLLMLLDSPLNKSDYLEIIVSTDAQKLISVPNRARLPRTFKRFAKIIGQLYERSTVKVGCGELMQFIRNPVNVHLPIDSQRFKIVSKPICSEKNADFVGKESQKPVVVEINVRDCGECIVSNIGNKISLSNFELPPELICAKVRLKKLIGENSRFN